MMKQLLSLLPVLFLASCATCWRGGDPLREVELQSLKAASADLHQAKNLKVYHGLAHPQRDAEYYQQQLKTVPNVAFAGFRFHKQPEPASAKLISNVVALYCDPQSHQALASPKTTCSGFHPDYALVWSNGDGQRVLQICYGCHEWKYFGPGGVLHTDINEPAYFDHLMNWLPPQP